MSVGAIAKALEVGVMRAQASSLSRPERNTLARWLGRDTATGISPEKLTNRCSSNPKLSPNAPEWSSWGAGLDNSRFQTADAAKLTAADLPRLKLKWAFAFEGATTMRSQPAFYGNRVFAGGQDGTVVSLDAATGCVYWSTAAAAQVRTGIVVAAVNGTPAVFFGDVTGQLYAVDATNGKPIWQLRADDHPAAMITATPAYHAGRLYVGVSSFEEAAAVSAGYVCCTFRGSVLAVDAATGKVIWKTWTVPDESKPGKPTRRGVKSSGPSGVGVWSSPTVDPQSGAVYVTTGDNYSDPPTATSDAVLALSLDSGRILWSQQMTKGDAYNSSCPLPDKSNCPDSEGPDFDFGSSAILIRLNEVRRALILPQKSGMLHAVDPDNKGRLIWQSRAGNGGVLGGIQWGAASDGSRIYVAVSDVGFTRTRQANSNNVLYTVDPERGGGMLAFRADNGERVWHTPPPGCADRRPCSPAQSQAVSGIPGAVFSGSMDGHLRAYSTVDGRILWDYDTAREFNTVNAIPGRGGAMDAGGAIVANGMVFAGSGYGQWGGLPGNVLLAFSRDGQ